MGRPLTAFCACELRSPAPFTEEGFTAFNRVYVGTLERWGVYRGGLNPVARSNVCPAVNPPSEPSLHAFSYTVPAEDDIVASFVVAGSGEAPEGMGNYRDHIIRRGDLSAAGLLEKARWVLGEMERRMGALGFAWRDTTATQLYTVHDVHPFLADEIVRRGAAAGGLRGTSAGRRWSSSTTRWTCAAWRGSWCSSSLRRHEGPHPSCSPMPGPQRRWGRQLNAPSTAITCPEM